MRPRVSASGLSAITCVPAEAFDERRGGVGQLGGLRLRVGLPEVGRMDAVGAGERLHFAVLREQRERRHVLAGQAAAQEIEQRERRAFDASSRRCRRAGAPSASGGSRPARWRAACGRLRPGRPCRAHRRPGGTTRGPAAAPAEAVPSISAPCGAVSVSRTCSAAPCGRCPGYGEARRPPRPTCSDLQALRALLVHSTSSPARALGERAQGWFSHQTKNGRGNAPSRPQAHPRRGKRGSHPSRSELPLGGQRP